MKNRIKKLIVALIMSSAVWDVSAVVIYPTEQPTWSNGTYGATCGFMYPNLQPLSQQRNLIAENALPNGSVLYSWGYDNFAPDFNALCYGESRYDTPSPSNYPELRIVDRLDFNGLSNDLLAGEWLWKTNNSGVALKLYMVLISRGEKNTGYTGEKSSQSTYVSDAINPIPVGQEITMTPSFGSTALIDGTMNSILSGGESSIGSSHYFKYSVRGELIKIGDIQVGTPLSLSSTANMVHSFFMNNNADDSQDTNIGYLYISPITIFGDGGINFVKPACQLRGNTDYLIDLGEWSSMTTLPAYSSIETVDVNIECSGVVENVEFSFQDMGDFSLNNHNVSLYDSIGGQPIEGLEIEMFYDGARLDVHNYNENPTIYKVNVGSHGSMKTNVSDLNFNSQSQAQFGVRFIQRAAITRNGNAYTGPVIGKVNMFVTYY